MLSSSRESLISFLRGALKVAVVVVGLAIVVTVWAWYRVQRSTPGSFISLAANVLRPTRDMHEWAEMNLPNLYNLHVKLKTKLESERMYYQLSISGKQDDLADLLKTNPSAKLRFALDDRDGFEIYQQSVALNQLVRTVSLTPAGERELLRKYGAPGTAEEEDKTARAAKATGLLPDVGDSQDMPDVVYSYESKGNSPMESNTYQKLTSWNVRLVE